VAIAIGSLAASLSLRSARQDTLALLWRAKLSEAEAIARTKGPGQRFKSLALIREAMSLARPLGLTSPDELRLRNAAIAALCVPDFQLVREWNGWPADARALSFDASLTRYARADKAGNVSIRRVQDDAEEIALPGNGEVASIRLSPDGRYLLCGGTKHLVGGALTVWRLGPGKPAVVHRDRSLSAAFACFTPDSTKAVYASTARLSLLNLETGIVTTWQLPGEPDQGGVVMHPAGQQVACARSIGGKHVVEIRELEGGKTVATFTHPGACSSLAWHPEGGLLAVACEDEKCGIHLWDNPAKRKIAVWKGIRTLAFNFGSTPAASVCLARIGAASRMCGTSAQGRKFKAFP